MQQARDKSRGDVEAQDIDEGFCQVCWMMSALLTWRIVFDGRGRGALIVC